VATVEEHFDLTFGAKFVGAESNRKVRLTVQGDELRVDEPNLGVLLRNEG
jgi:hypothetical protein